MLGAAGARNLLACPLPLPPPVASVSAPCHFAVLAPHLHLILLNRLVLDPNLYALPWQVLLPPLTAFEVARTRVDGSVLIVTLQVSKIHPSSKAQHTHLHLTLF